MPTHAASLVRLLARRLSLLDSGFYLGDNHVLNNVEWVRDGRADRLAVKTFFNGDEDEEGTTSG